MNLGDIKGAYLEFEKSYLNYYLQRSSGLYENKLHAAKMNLKEVSRRYKDHKNQKVLLEKEIKLAQKALQRKEGLYQKGVISQQELESQKLSFYQKKEQLNNSSIAVSQVRDEVNTISQDLKVTQLNQIESNSRIKKELLINYSLLKKAINDWEYYYVLSTSINGIVSFQEFWGINQNVSINEEIYTIFPIDNSELVGKLKLPSRNAGKVKSGQKVLLKLNNFPYQQYGMLIGRVENISLTPNKNGEYFVYISFPDGTKTTYGKELIFKQELLGNAEIVTEDLSIAERIFYQFKNIF